MDSLEKVKYRLDILEIEIQAVSDKYRGSSGWRYDASKYLLYELKYKQLMQVKKMSELLATKSIMVK